jgi:uncharacterized membrane protein HdeD (DUF308 family)
MNTPPTFEELRRRELHFICEAWVLLLILGIMLVVVGSLAIASAFIATLATVTLFGTFLVVGAAMQLVSAVTCRNGRGFLVHLLAGILYAVVGLIMMNHPLQAAAGLTLMLAAAFMASGILRIVGAAVEHFHGWPWVMINGFITLFLGIYIWRHFPESAFWVIGLFVGIELIFTGLAWIMLVIARPRLLPPGEGQ